MFGIIIMLIVIGVVLWLANTYIPMDDRIKKIMNIVVIIGVIIWLLSAFGVFDYLKAVPAPHVAIPLIQQTG